MNSFAELMTEHREWSLRNFGPHTAVDPLEGLIEELGELAHARVKGRQGIRGTPADFIEKEKDAIGDIVVFLADYTTCRGMTPKHDWTLQTPQEPSRPGPPTAQRAMLGLARGVGELAGAEMDNMDDQWALNEILDWLVHYCNAREFDLKSIVTETWATVSKRDWTKNKLNGVSQ